MLDWNDLRYFLAVAREGSTLAAGRQLRVSQTTVARRIAALEAAVGFPLFDKRQAGYALTPAGEGLMDRAKQVDIAAAAFTESAAADRNCGAPIARGCTTSASMIASSCTMHPPWACCRPSAPVSGLRSCPASSPTPSLTSCNAFHQEAITAGRCGSPPTNASARRHACAPSSTFSTSGSCVTPATSKRD